MKPIVSVIIPVYNGENSVSGSLNSLLSQTYSDFEVVIIDDGSIDRTPEVIADHIEKDNRFSYTYQENAGVAAARNKGLELAKGDYICFLDADDFYEKDFIEKLVSKVKKESADVCYCGYNVVSPMDKHNKKTKFKSGDILLDYILGTVSIHTTSWLVRKKLLQQYSIRFTDGVSWGEDFEFFCEVLAMTDKVCFVDEYLTNYMVDHGGEQLSAFSLDKIDKDFESIQRIIKNRKTNKNIHIENSLRGYRFPALAIYRLNIAKKKNIDAQIIKKYYKKYEKYIEKISYNNGLRSIKLWVYRFTLERYISKQD